MVGSMRRAAVVLAGAMAAAAAAAQTIGPPTRFVNDAGEPIHEVRIEGNRSVGAEEMRNALDLGPDHFETAVAAMEGATPFRKVDWEIRRDEDGRLIGIIRVGAIGSPTRFLNDLGRPIDEVRIEGNQRVSVGEIRNALGLGPDHFETAVAVMEAVLPFRKVDWKIRREEDGRLIGIIRVEEHSINQLRSTGLNRFDRAHGFQYGARVEWERRRDVRKDPIGSLFAEASRGFSSDRWLHRWGVSLNLNLGGGAALTASAERRRDAAVRDDEAPNEAEQGAMALLFGHEFRDYYERFGTALDAELSLEDGIHAFQLNLSQERHCSLKKTTDWSLLRWRSRKFPIAPIDDGRYAGVLLRYEFDSLADWRAYAEMEHALPRFGSDFAFTRAGVSVRMRRYLDNGQLLLRLKAEASRGAVPIQRSLNLGGPGTLLGYERHAFQAARGALLNMEYRMRVLTHLPLKLYALFFVDAAALPEAGMKFSGGYGALVEDGLYLRFARGRFAAVDFRFANRF